MEPSHCYIRMRIGCTAHAAHADFQTLARRLAKLAFSGRFSASHCYIRIRIGCTAHAAHARSAKRLLSLRPCNRWQRWHAAARRRRTVKPALSAPRKELAFSGKFIGFTAHADFSRVNSVAASALSRRRQRRHPTARGSAAPQSRPQWNPALLHHMRIGCTAHAAHADLQTLAVVAAVQPLAALARSGAATPNRKAGAIGPWQRACVQWQVHRL